LLLLAGCSAEQVGQEGLNLTYGEAAALVRTGQDFILSEQEEERNADEVRRLEALRSPSPGGLSTAPIESISFRIEVRRAGEGLSVRFTPYGEGAENLRDGTVEYEVSAGTPPRRVSRSLEKISGE
jgi:hypothetical protein